MKDYLVVFERNTDGWSAYVPDLPGCVAFGETKAETEGLIREALNAHIEGLVEDGETVPEPSSESEYIAAVK